MTLRTCLTTLVFVSLTFGCNLSDDTGSGSDGGSITAGTAASSGAGAGAGSGGSGGASGAGHDDAGTHDSGIAGQPADASADDDATTPDGDAGPCPTFDATFIDTLRGCKSDGDCKAVSYQSNCCGTHVAVAVHTDQLERFAQCAPDPTGYPACGCASQPTRVDDGRISEQYDLSDVAARCIAGSCRSEVIKRSCGTKPVVCGEGQICVTFETTLGPSQTLDYACMNNPCTDTLACSCAQPLCDTRTDVTRSCLLDYTPDVYCSDPRQ